MPQAFRRGRPAFQTVQRDPQHHPFALDTHHMRHLKHPSGEICPLFRDLVEQRLVEPAQHFICSRTDHRIAAESGPVVAAAEHRFTLFPEQDRPDRQSAAQPFGKGGQVGGNPVVLGAEQLPGAANTGLYLVDHQQDVLLGTELRRRADKLL